MNQHFGMPTTAKTAFGALLCLCLAACSDTVSQQVPDIPAALTDQQVSSIWNAWPESLRSEIVSQVYSDRFNTSYRLCPDAAFKAEHSQPFDLSLSDTTLPSAANGDLGCALAGFGHWVVAGRRSGDERQLLSLVHEGKRLLLVEVETDGNRITAVSVVSHPAKRRTLVMRNRPPEAASIIPRWHKTTKIQMSESESLDFLRAMVGQGSFDLAGIGIEDSAVLAARIEQEPGCAQTGECPPIPPCGPARRDNVLLKAAMYPPDQKAEICKHLAAWRHDRHDMAAPDEKVVKRALVLAIQDETPELDASAADGSRVVAEHSKSGYRLISLSSIAPALMTIPRQHFVISDVENLMCKGNDRTQSCSADVSVQAYQRALNMPNSVQRDLIESMAREYRQPLQLRFERRYARWELVDHEETLADLRDWSEANVTKGFVDYFRERASSWR